MLVIGMMVFQNVRRTYECLFVSVYSAGTINLLHYSLGLYHYSAFAFAMFSEAPPIKYAKGLFSQSIVKSLGQKAIYFTSVGNLFLDARLDCLYLLTHFSG